MIDGLGLAGFFLLHHDMLELAREVAVEVRGPDTARALLPPGRGRGSSVSSIVCYLTGLSHIDPISSGLSMGRFLNPELSSVPGHRPRLPPRHPRGPDPPGPRPLRSRPGRTGRDLSELPLAGGDPRARQGARPPAGRDRAGRPWGGRLRPADRTGHRDGARTQPQARRPVGLAGIALPRGLRPPPACLPAPGRDGHRHATPDRLRPDRPGRDGGPAARPVGQGLLRRCRLPEDRPARTGHALGGRAVRRDDRPDPRRADRPLANPLRRRGDLYGDPGRRDDRRLPDREPRPDAVAPPDTAGEPRGAAVQVAIIRPGPDPGRSGQPLHRASPPPARGSRLRAAMPAPVARAGAPGDARDDHLPGPGDRGRPGVLRLLAGRGRRSPPGDEPQARRRGDRPLPGALHRRRRASTSAPSRRSPEAVWEMVAGFAGFGFPKAHSAAFGLLAYQSTWLRVHYGPEFLCALLNEQPMGFYPPDSLVHEAQRRGIELLAVDINASAADCTVEAGGGVRIGLGYVSGVRAEEIAALVLAREQTGAFRSLAELAGAGQRLPVVARAARLVGRLRRPRRGSPAGAVGAWHRRPRPAGTRRRPARAGARDRRRRRPCESSAAGRSCSPTTRRPASASEITRWQSFGPTFRVSRRASS